MPIICPVCSKQRFSYQSVIQCKSCQGWVHHANRLNCSGLSDNEFIEHTTDDDKPYECDHCIIERNSGHNRSNFVTLPFTHESDINIFNAPTLNQRPDVNSLNPEELRKFVQQCKSIRKQLNSEHNTEDDFFSTQVNSKYYDIKKLKHSNT